MNGLEWEGKEDAILHSFFSLKSRSQLMALLPRRSWHAIKKRAHYLKLSRNVERPAGWTEQEDAILLSEYENTPDLYALAKRLGRTRRACLKRASVLGIKRNQSVWRANRLESLKEAYAEGRVCNSARLPRDRGVVIPKGDPWAKALAKYKQVAA